MRGKKKGISEGREKLKRLGCNGIYYRLVPLDLAPIKMLLSASLMVLEGIVIFFSPLVWWIAEAFLQHNIQNTNDITWDIYCIFKKILEASLQRI